MSKEIVVPEGMLKAVRSANDGVSSGYIDDYLKHILSAALLWLSEHADQFVPSRDRLISLFSITKEDAGGGGMPRYVQICIEEMFLAPKEHKHRWVADGIEHFRCECGEEITGMLVTSMVVSGTEKAPEEEIPEVVKDLLSSGPTTWSMTTSTKEFNRCVLEAYRRGRLAR